MMVFCKMLILPCVSPSFEAISIRLRHSDVELFFSQVTRRGREGTSLFGKVYIIVVLTRSVFRPVDNLMSSRLQIIH